MYLTTAVSLKPLARPLSFGLYENPVKILLKVNLCVSFRILVRSSLHSLHVVTSPSLLGVHEHYNDPFSWIETLTQVLKLTKPLQVIVHYTAALELVKLERVKYEDRIVVFHCEYKVVVRFGIDKCNLGRNAYKFCFSTIWIDKFVLIAG
jgi:hypothetical protein